jgi:hypothetical protein
MDQTAAATPTTTTTATTTELHMRILDLRRKQLASSLHPA